MGCCRSKHRQPDGRPVPRVGERPPPEYQTSSIERSHSGRGGRRGGDEVSRETRSTLTPSTDDSKASWATEDLPLSERCQRTDARQDWSYGSTPSVAPGQSSYYSRNQPNAGAATSLPPRATGETSSLSTSTNTPFRTSSGLNAAQSWPRPPSPPAGATVPSIPPSSFAGPAPVGATFPAVPPSALAPPAPAPVAASIPAIPPSLFARPPLAGSPKAKHPSNSPRAKSTSNSPRQHLTTNPSSTHLPSGPSSTSLKGMRRVGDDSSASIASVDLKSHAIEWEDDERCLNHGHLLQPGKRCSHRNCRCHVGCERPSCEVCLRNGMKAEAKVDDTVSQLAKLRMVSTEVRPPFAPNGRMIKAGAGTRRNSPRAI